MNVQVSIPVRQSVVSELCDRLRITEATAKAKIRAAIRVECINELKQCSLVVTIGGPNGRRSSVEVERDEWLEKFPACPAAIVIEGIV